MSETPAEQEQAEVEAQQAPTEEGTEPTEADQTQEQPSGTPEGATVGDNQPDEGDHPVDQTPPQTENDPLDKPAEAYDDGETERMHKEPGVPNERGQGGGDGTVWNG